MKLFVNLKNWIVFGFAAVFHWTKLILLGIKHAAMWLYYEIFFWFSLFKYTTRRFFRFEAFLTLAGAFVYFGFLLTQSEQLVLREMLEHCYLFFSVVMVLLSMNLLPRERDEDTLEILWSQPMSRSGLILLQLFTLTFWTFLLSLITMLFFSYFSAYDESFVYPAILLAVTLYGVGAITVLVSTFCRHSIATGLVSLLILGLHFYWLRQLGPIDMYFNPLPLPDSNDRINSFDVIFNRIVIIVLIGFILDYVFRRLKRTAEWFT